jgi:hypothetical protein
VSRRRHDIIVYASRWILVITLLVRANKGAQNCMNSTMKPRWKTTGIIALFIPIFQPNPALNQFNIAEEIRVIPIIKRVTLYSKAPFVYTSFLENIFNLIQRKANLNKITKCSTRVSQLWSETLIDLKSNEAKAEQNSCSSLLKLRKRLKFDTRK